MIDYLERGKTVTGDYYAELIRKLWAAIKEKRRGKLIHGLLRHQDNAPAHTSAVAMATIRECGFELLSQPPYSPDSTVWLLRVPIFERFASWTELWRECGFELLSQPPYSPDLAPSDYHVFRSLKDSLRGRSFGCDEEVIHTIDDWFELQDKQFFVDGVNSLAHRWEKRVVLEGDYIEKL